MVCFNLSSLNSAQKYQEISTPFKQIKKSTKSDISRLEKSIPKHGRADGHNYTEVK